MKRLLLAVLLVLAALPLVHAQTAPDPGPTYVVGTGITYDYYGKTGFASTTTVALKVTGGLYQITTLDLTRDTSVMKAGVGYTLIKNGRWSLMGLGDAGGATGSGPTLLSASGGMALSYDVGSLLTKGKSSFYIIGGGRANHLASLPIAPTFTISFGKGL